MVGGKSGVGTGVGAGNGVGSATGGWTALISSAIWHTVGIAMNVHEAAVDPAGDIAEAVDEIPRTQFIAIHDRTGFALRSLAVTREAVARSLAQVHTVKFDDSHRQSDARRSRICRQDIRHHDPRFGRQNPVEQGKRPIPSPAHRVADRVAL